MIVDPLLHVVIDAEGLGGKASTTAAAAEALDGSAGGGAVGATFGVPGLCRG